MLCLLAANWFRSGDSASYLGRVHHDSIYNANIAALMEVWSPPFPPAPLPLFCFFFFVCLSLSSCLHTEALQRWILKQVAIVPAINAKENLREGMQTRNLRCHSSSSHRTSVASND